MGGDKMTKAEVDDIFGEFEIDEDYCIKTKEVISLFVLLRKRRRRSQLPHQRLLRLLPQRKRMILRRKRRRRRRLLSKCHPSYWCSGCVLSSTTPCKKTRKQMPRVPCHTHRVTML